MSTHEIKKQRLTTALKWGAGLAAAAVIAPFIFLAVKGLIGLGIALAIGLVLIHFAPLASRWLATKALEGFKGVARQNPVETRQVISMKRQQELAARAEAIRDFGAEVLNVDGHVKELERAGDAEGAAELAHTAFKLRQVLEVRKIAYQRAVEAQQAYDEVTKKVARRWKAAQAALKAQKLAGPSADKELDRIMSEEALDSVETAMNKVFADLDHAMLTESLSITNNPSPVLDVQARVVQKVAA